MYFIKITKNISNIQIVRFLFVGGLAFLVDYVGFLLFHYWLNISVSISGALSFILGLGTSFFMQRQWVFTGNKDPGVIKKEATLYIALALFNLLVTTYGLVFLNGIGIKPYIAKFILIICITSWNFALYRKVIFKTH